ncbi:transglutaminase domain-containing protein [Clostridium sp. JS66]|uniref:transglutaminase domain-containing protein n=1 Tax=Clostridium sp. JS66 TaxID=3064705 RepID=UPI00298E377A|nr:transglutaminase domain-containing protein [Clostridium sp. JS66]WPC40212.1 transglutaminase domain-containing protein [Clostridium sp. JS66]
MKKLKFIITTFTLIIFTISCTIIFNNPVIAKETVYEATTQLQMEDIIFNAITNRETSLKIEFTGDTSNIMNLVRESRDNATKRDPYEEGCIALISGFGISKFADHADISFNLFQYYTTKEQEDFVNTEVKRIVNQITNISMNEDEKEKAIYEYIISNVNYDNTLAGYTAYSALHDKVTVCNGYAQLVYKMMEQAGLDTKIIKGSIGSSENSINHEWNMVNIKGNWYHLDATLDKSNTKDSKVISTKYYNVNDDFISNTHTYDKTKYPTASKAYVFTPSIQPPVEHGSDPNTGGSSGNAGNNTPSNPPTKPELPQIDPNTGGNSGNISTGGNNTQPKPNTKPELPTDVREIKTFMNDPQPSNKIWEVSFTENINLSNINNSNIFVVDSNGNAVEGISFGKGHGDNKLLIYPPKLGYVNGQRYYLYIIKNLTSLKGKKLKTNIKISFTIK